MRRFLLLFLLISYSALMRGQQTSPISGDVADDVGQPLEYASVQLLKQGKGTYTNQRGQFLLPLSANASGDTLRIAYLGFEPFYIALTTAASPLHIRLRPAAANLREVTVRPTDPVSLIKAARKRIPLNYPVDPFVSHCFYRIDTRKGDAHIMLSEAAFDIANPGYSSSRSERLYLHKMRSFQDEQASQGIDLGMKPNGIFDFDVVRGIASSPLLGGDGLRKHDFALKGVSSMHGRRVYVIMFDQKEGLRESLYKGRILLDVESLAFVSVDMARSPRGIMYARFGNAATRVLMKIMDLAVGLRQERQITSYQPVGNRWALAAVRNDISLHLKSNRSFYDFTADIKVDYIITGVDTLPEAGTLQGAALGNNKLIEFQRPDTAADFWKDYNILLPDFDTDAVIAAINARNADASLKNKIAPRLRKMRGGPVARIDSICSYYHRNGAFTGTALVLHRGQTLLDKGYGLANKSAGLHNSDTTQFRVGSLAKAFTGQLILQLSQEGKLRLSDSLGTFLPGHPHGAVTITQLLTHTSGIPSYSKNEAHMAAMLQRPYTTREIAALFCSDTLLFKPGERFSYSNSGYALLAAVIEKASGQSYGALFREKILSPAGMRQTAFNAPRTNSTGYWMGAPEPAFPVVNMVGAGGITSTAADLIRWEAAMRAGKILPDSLLATSTRPAAFYPDWDADYGYGWMIDRKLFDASRKHTVIYHPGTDFGYYSMFVRVPDTQTVVVLLSNGGDFPRFDMTDLILGTVDE
ncbi:serine hydrolase [Chitinophaga lutea]